VIGQADVESAIREFAPQGPDAVIIMAATPSNEPLELAAKVARERARIIVAGLVGLRIPRELFFDKELELVVSRAWGSGVFDPLYVEKGIDYPYAYARWTAKRNLEEFLVKVAQGAVKVNHLITHRFPIEQAIKAYELILEGKELYIGVLITYPATEKLLGKHKVELKTSLKKSSIQKKKMVGVGVIGAGLFATTTLLPILNREKRVKLKGIATTTGYKGWHAGKKFGFEYCTTDYRELLDDPDIDLIMILTRHGSHSNFVIEALRAGKHVYVEKPLAIHEEQLRAIIEAYNEVQRESKRILFVGFNRRFSPFTVWLKERFQDVIEPLAVQCTINAGLVPADHWVHDLEEGGGRIIGEACHFVDLIQYITNSVPIRVYAETLGSKAYKTSDNIIITLKMANGSIGSITYISGGDKSFPREQIEVFGGGAVGVIDNFRKAIFVCGGHRKIKRSFLSIDRGHQGELEALLDTLCFSGEPPIGFEQYIYTTLATFAIEESLKEGVPIDISNKVQSLLGVNYE